MKRFLFLFVLLSFLPVGHLKGQILHSGTVELIEIDESTAAFQVEGIAGKKGELLISAKETLFHRLFKDGVEGFNDDEKLVESVTNKNSFYLQKFFEGKNAPMNRFISGIAQINTPLKDDIGQFHCIYTITVKYKALARDLELNQLRSGGIAE